MPISGPERGPKKHLDPFVDPQGEPKLSPEDVSTLLGEMVSLFNSTPPHVIVGTPKERETFKEEIRKRRERIMEEGGIDIDDFLIGIMNAEARSVHQVYINDRRAREFGIKWFLD